MDAATAADEFDGRDSAAWYGGGRYNEGDHGTDDERSFRNVTDEPGWLAPRV